MVSPDDGHLPLVGHHRGIGETRVNIARMRSAQPNHGAHRLAFPVKIVLGQGGEVASGTTTAGHHHEVTVKVGVNLLHQIVQLTPYQLVRI